MEYISIINLEEYIHYSDRDVSWTKLKCNIISHHKFVGLSDWGKLAYLLLIPLATQHKNKLPRNNNLLTQMLHLNRQLNVRELEEAGLIKFWENSNLTTQQKKGMVDVALANMVIGYLNERAEKNFKETDGNRQHILQRLRHAYREEDCFAVIDNRIAHWTDTEMDQYLRPNTLFRPKNFESYLNSKLPKEINGTTQDKFNAGRLSASKSALKNFVEGGTELTGLKTITGG